MILTVSILSGLLFVALLNLSYARELSAASLFMAPGNAKIKLNQHSRRFLSVQTPFQLQFLVHEQKPKDARAAQHFTTTTTASDVVPKNLNRHGELEAAWHLGGI